MQPKPKTYPDFKDVVDLSALPEKSINNIVKDHGKRLQSSV